MCPPRSSSTVGLTPPDSLDVEDKPWLAFLSGPSGPQENIKVADLFRLDNAGGSDRKVCRRRASKDGWVLQRADARGSQTNGAPQSPSAIHSPILPPVSSPIHSVMPHESQ